MQPPWYLKSKFPLQSPNNIFYCVVVIILDEQIFLTYVLNCEMCSKSKEQVSEPKVFIVENWKQFPIVTLNMCRKFTKQLV